MYLHAEALCHKCHAVAKLAGQRQLIECLRQPSDGIFALLRGRAVNGNALGFHADTALDRRDSYLVRRDFGSRVRRTLQLRRRIRGRDVGGGTALELCQAVIAGLVQLSAVSAVENALFAVDDRVFAVRREAVHRQFAAMRNVPRHIAAAGLLVGAEQQTDALGGRESGILERRQRVDGRHHRALVVHRAASVNTAVFDFAGKRLGLGPAVAGGHNVQMTEHSHHFLALAVLAPADAVVHIAGSEAQLFAERKRFVQRTGRLTAERRMIFRHAFHARYAYERGKTFQQLVRVRTDVGFAVHNKNLLNRVDYSSDWEWLSTKWLFLYAISPSRCMRLSSADSALRSTPR